MAFTDLTAPLKLIGVKAGLTLALALLAQASLSPANATPALVIDAASGAILYQEEATRPWFPASITKLMTVYVALNAVRQGRLTLQTPLRVSPRAARAVPSKMGFKPGTEVTLENALKIIMVKSANDTSITIAEGVSGSVEAFAAEMNANARRLGMRESHFVNPNGLHNPAHVTSARDMAILARALLNQFPAHRNLYGIGALQLGRRIIPTHNGLIGRYPGADGMKTGFVCASGFNVVATATRGGRKLIAIVMGAKNARVRTLQAMALFDTAFSKYGSGTPESLPASGHASAPDMRPEICGRNRNRDIGETPVPIATTNRGLFVAPEDSPAAFFAADKSRAWGSVPSSSSPALASVTSGALGPREPLQPIPIYIGRAPGWTGGVRGPDTVAEEPAKPESRTQQAARPAGAPVRLLGAAARPEKATRASARNQRRNAAHHSGRASRPRAAHRGPRQGFSRPRISKPKVSKPKARSASAMRRRH